MFDFKAISSNLIVLLCWRKFQYYLQDLSLCLTGLEGQQYDFSNYFVLLLRNIIASSGSWVMLWIKIHLSYQDVLDTHYMVDNFLVGFWCITIVSTGVRGCFTSLYHMHCPLVGLVLWVAISFWGIICLEYRNFVLFFGPHNLSRHCNLCFAP